MSEKTLGQVAFEAYRAAVNGQTFDDKQIPEWNELHGNRARVHAGWEAAAAATLRALAERALSNLERALSRWRPLDAPKLAPTWDSPQLDQLTPVTDGEAAAGAGVGAGRGRRRR
jgi:hypothetical protein